MTRWDYASGRIMSAPTNPMYSPLLGCVLPVLKPEGLSDEAVAAQWDEYGPKAYDPTKPRNVQLGANQCAWVMHPADVAAGMSRIPAYRTKKKRGRR